MKRTMVIVALGVIIVTLLASLASATQTTVQTTVINGTRAMTMKSLSGDSLSSISIGKAGTGAMLTNVSDVQYSNIGYQVSAALSDLYKYDSGTYDCATKISSSALGLSFLTSPTSIAGVKALTQPAWNLAGSLTAGIASVLGVATGTSVSVAGLSAEPAESTLSGTFTGLQSTLPVQVTAGAGGAFSAPAPHTTCDPTPSSSATQRLIMSGAPNSAAALFAWIQSAVTSAGDANSDGSVTASELVSTGAVTDPNMATATRTALATAGVSLTVLDTAIALGTITMSQIYALLTATLQPITSLLGQTGSYVAVPQLSATIPSNTLSGTYRGTMTVTLVDVP